MDSMSLRGFPATKTNAPHYPPLLVQGPRQIVQEDYGQFSKSGQVVKNGVSQYELGLSSYSNQLSTRKVKNFPALFESGACEIFLQGKPMQISIW